MATTRRPPYDPPKREKTLAERGLDFEDAKEVFAGPTMTEERYVTIGRLRGLEVVVVWTLRDGERRIISMRRAHEKEREYFREQFGEAGGDER